MDQKTIKATIKHGGGNVLVWGCFSYNGVGNLVQIEEKLTGAGYVNILRNNLMPSVNRLGLLDHFVFQQDNDPKHTSRVGKAYFEENEIELLDWPAQSPDINPIKNLWYNLDDKVKRDENSNKKPFSF